MSVELKLTIYLVSRLENSGSVKIILTFNDKTLEGRPDTQPDNHHIRNIYVHRSLLDAQPNSLRDGVVTKGREKQLILNMYEDIYISDEGIDALVEFLYTGKYTQEDYPVASFHFKVYAIADRFGFEELRRLAYKNLNKFLDEMALTMKQPEYEDQLVSPQRKNMHSELLCTLLYAFVTFPGCNWLDRNNKPQNIYGYLSPNEQRVDIYAVLLKFTAKHLKILNTFSEFSSIIDSSSHLRKLVVKSMKDVDAPSANEKTEDFGTKRAPIEIINNHAGNVKHEAKKTIIKSALTDPDGRTPQKNAAFMTELKQRNKVSTANQSTASGGFGKSAKVDNKSASKPQTGKDTKRFPASNEDDGSKSEPSKKRRQI